MSGFSLPRQFAERLKQEARRLRVHPEDHLTKLLEPRVAALRSRDPAQHFDYSGTIFCLSDELSARVRRKAAQEGVSPEELIVSTLDRVIVPEENLVPGVLEDGLDRLQAFLARIPAIEVISASKAKVPIWWIKFDIDLRSAIAWHVVQNLAFVLNDICISECLPTVFKPKSPPPYLNGGPREFLHWVIEATIPLLNAGVITDFLEERLPSPVEDEKAWLIGDDEENVDNEKDSGPVDIEAWSAGRRGPELDDCERIGNSHKWFNVDGVHSACYNCRVVRKGQLW